MNTKIKIILFIFFLAVLLFGFGVSQTLKLNTAHSTFDNYYAFRGCVQLLERTDAYGICRTSSGQTIKMVLINGKWYLEGDGPGIW